MKKDIDGRQFIAMHEVRGAIVSANASLTTGTATSLIAGDSDYFLDIVEMTCANNSAAAVSLTLMNDGTTIRTITIPATDTKHFKFDVPLKQQTKSTTWVADMEDVTGTTVTIDAYLIKNT